ncbi:MAG TPA: hypothetical protein VHH57_12050 [Gaiella sp.]|nr:hypothetical protein [Gaiella sp.]
MSVVERLVRLWTDRWPRLTMRSPPSATLTTDPVSIKGVDVPLASEPVQLVQRSESP